MFISEVEGIWGLRGISQLIIKWAEFFRIGILFFHMCIVSFSVHYSDFTSVSSLLNSPAIRHYFSIACSVLRQRKATKFCFTGPLWGLPSQRLSYAESHHEANPASFTCPYVQIGNGSHTMYCVVCFSLKLGTLFKIQRIEGKVLFMLSNI